MEKKEKTIEMLRQVQAGTLSPEQAALQLKLAPFEDLGYAKIDHHRALRQGAAEVIYGQSKTPEQIAGIVQAMEQRGGSNILITRIPAQTADYLAQRFPLNYEPLAKLAVALPQPVEGRGFIVVATGGTSDMGVAEVMLGLNKGVCHYCQTTPNL